MPKHKYLGLGHVLARKKVDHTIEYTSRIEFLRCGDGLKSFDHGYGSSGVLDLFTLLILLLVPFPDTYGHRVRKSERRRSDVFVQTADTRNQRYHLRRLSLIDTHDRNDSNPYREVEA